MNRKTILVVDDEEILREAIASYFRRCGFDVKIAANGLEALRVMQECRADIVVSDVQMPELNGKELIREIKKRDPDMPVIIFITAFADLSAEEAYNLGAAAVMPKPFDRKAMLSLVTKLSNQGFPHEEQNFPANVKRSTQEIEVSETDLGKGGVRLTVPWPEAHLNDVVQFQVNAKVAGATLALKGCAVVRWAKPFGPGQTQVGLEFLYLDESCRESFFQWVRGTKPIPFIPQAA